jgi:hypothetical protein
MDTRHRWLPGSSDEDVVCIACGTGLPRSAAREYDKHGDRWSREDKEFEYLCKPCFRDCCHQPRPGLEDALVRAGAGRADDRTFLERYCDSASEEDGGEAARDPDA